MVLFFDTPRRNSESPQSGDDGSEALSGEEAPIQDTREADSAQPPELGGQHEAGQRPVAGSRDEADNQPKPDDQEADGRREEKRDRFLGLLKKWLG